MIQMVHVVQWFTNHQWWWCSIDKVDSSSVSISFHLHLWIIILVYPRLRWPRRVLEICWGNHVVPCVCWGLRAYMLTIVAPIPTSKSFSILAAVGEAVTSIKYPSLVGSCRKWDQGVANKDPFDRTHPWTVCELCSWLRFGRKPWTMEASAEV